MDDSSKQTLCLAMIVKDESHIIRETLTKLLTKIQFDYWVICDTGSTDSTKDIITEFFREKGISGELIEEPWKNFAHNRTIVFKNAYKKSDYVFVWDADDEIVGDFKLPTPLTADWYRFTFSGGTTYIRPQLFRNTLRWKYISVLHEVAVCEEPAGEPVFVSGAYHFVSGRLGNRSKDPNKYLKDAQLLEKAYYECLETKDSLHNRYAFYCAQSYMDCGKYENAIEFYKKVLGHENWSEEKYIACMNIYDCYKALGKEEEGLSFLVRSTTYNSRRIECVYKLILYYCHHNRNDIAYMYYTLIQKYYETEFSSDHTKDWLFVHVSEYEFYLPYYMIIVAERLKKHETCAKMCEIICRFKYKDVNEFYMNNWLFNMQFFIDRLPKTPEFTKNFRTYIDSIKAKTIQLGSREQDVVSKLLTIDNGLKEHLERIHNNQPIPQNHVTYLKYLKSTGFEPKVIYDIGSCVLHWTKIAKTIWPDATYILFDAFAPAEFLYKGYDYHIGVLSDTDNKPIQFYQNDYSPGGNSYYREIGFDNGKFFPESSIIEKITKTLDTIVKERGFPLPDFVKIDVQGAEVDIIRGGVETIRNAKRMIVELQNVEYNLGAKKADESLPLIESLLNFKCTDPLFQNNGPDGDYGFVNSVG